MSYNIFSLTDHDNTSDLNASSYTFLPDAFQQTLPPARTNHPQNNQFLNSVALTQFAHLPNNIHQQLPINTIPAWKPSRRLQKKLIQLFDDHYNQFPCLPCVYYGQLLYPEKAAWVTQEDLSIYALFQVYPSISIRDIAHPGATSKLPTCHCCKLPLTRLQIPRLAEIPQAINDVPYGKRKYLSPIFLHSSLGRSTNANAYTEYRSIVGTMGLSKNLRTLTLYSGMLGAFLENLDNSSNDNNWYHHSLQPAVNWLQQNNPYLRSYSTLANRLLLMNNASEMSAWPTAFPISQDNSVTSFQHNDVVVPNFNFAEEVHNEDSLYSRLAAGFLCSSDGNNLPISISDPNLEPLLFPDLFPDGRGHYRDANNSYTNIETYGKYIKRRIMGIDPRFRLHHTWPAWSYLQLEKIRNHQNRQRLLRQRNVNNTSLPTGPELLRRSVYDGRLIVDEDKSTTLPSFIRTGDTYFRGREFHLNAMVNELGLPSLFITLTMAEFHWENLQSILRSTDNHDTVPTNRPYHVTSYFLHRYRVLKQHIWKAPRLAEWGNIIHFFERFEFQNRGAVHLHGCLWNTMSVCEMINNNIIRCDLPDPDEESELYAKVMAHQIHTCNPTKCGGPPLSGEQCRKGFPRKYSPITYEDPETRRFIYRCVREQDQYVVPYHAPTLLAWDAHMNIQYVSSRGFARYMTKYIAKTEPSHIFNIREGDRFYQHITARRMSSMEIMFMILGEPICNSSIAVRFLTTDPPDTRTRTIMPVALVLQNEAEPYYKDTIEKYFARPRISLFECLTYEQYYRKFDVSTTPPRSRTRTLYQDLLGNWVMQRANELIVRFRPLRISDGEPYFYQQLLHQRSWRNETEMYGPYQTYRDHYLSLFPEQRLEMYTETTAHMQHYHLQLTNRFAQLLDDLLSKLQNEINYLNVDVIKLQLDHLKIISPITPPQLMVNLPEDQYKIMDILTNKLGNQSNKKYPYFFVTGSAGTGKSYIIHLLTKFLAEHRSKFLLMAPTGVAAQRIDGKTIHSALRITHQGGTFVTRALTDPTLKSALREIKTLIIDEVSMVSAQLLSFISDLLAKIHGNASAFGGISVVLVGDLAQLPPVSGTPVYYSPVWKLFYPLFLTHSRRQENDLVFYQLLEEVRFGNVSPSSWRMLRTKLDESISSTNSSSALTTTHIVGYRESAMKINVSVCNLLNTPPSKFIINYAIDTVNGSVCSFDETHSMFKDKTNLPKMIRLQQGARVMFLNNQHFDKGICNGTIGVVTDVDREHLITRVAFAVQDGIIDLEIRCAVSTFYINGKLCSRKQFPLQNCFATTVHKAQGLTLPDICLVLDKQFFSPGQAYVALSRATSWNSVRITALDEGAFLVDKNVATEYERLKRLADQIPI